MTPMKLNTTQVRGGAKSPHKAQKMGVKWDYFPRFTIFNPKSGKICPIEILGDLSRVKPSVNFNHYRCWLM
jgi:hypothetical protein